MLPYPSAATDVPTDIRSVSATEDTKYRPDIDGLRAIAVLAVVGYHAYPGLMKSGFIGVDVFFVVSGFLITSIILDTLRRGTFGFVDFYVRRIRRIFPALVTVLVATFGIGWFLLAADELKSLGRHTMGGAGFASNLLLWQESGYFDTVSERKPLLHLWSLGIEEQFYLLFPIILWLTWKRARDPLPIVALIAIASFTWNIAVAGWDPAMDFYSPQTRIWELMIGALLAGVAQRQNKKAADITKETDRKKRARRNFASACGAALLGLAALLITRERAFPGAWALLPTLGTALLLMGGRDAWINRRVLSNRMLVWFGLISFPLYLWHWPLLSYAYIQEGGLPSRQLKFLLVALSVLLAALTYRFVERPIRFGRAGKAAAGWLLVALCATGLLGFAVYRGDGFGQRTVAKDLEARLRTARLAGTDGDCVETRSDRGTSSKERFCTIGSASKAPETFIYGDSHAVHMLPALSRLARASGTNYLFANASLCPPLLGVRIARPSSTTAEKCLELNREIFERVRASGIRNVLLIARWAYYDDTYLQTEAHAPADDHPLRALRHGLARTIEAYRAIGVHVLVLGDNPLQAFQPRDALRKSDGTASSINALSVTKTTHDAYQGRVTDALASLAGDAMTFVNPIDAYCDHTSCPLMHDDAFLYTDLDHLSPSGSMLAYSLLSSALARP